MLRQNYRQGLPAHEAVAFDVLEVLYVVGAGKDGGAQADGQLGRRVKLAPVETYSP